MAWSMTSTETKKRGNLVARIVILVILGIGVLLVGLTFFWFVSPATESVESVEPADAVVVFIGGGDRLDTVEELIETILHWEKIALFRMSTRKPARNHQIRHYARCPKNCFITRTII